MNVPTCLVLVGNPIDPAVSGLAPSDFQTRYNLPSTTKGSGQVVALVDAYDQPNAASDLQTYRTQWGLGKGKFNKYNQSGQKKNYPQSCAGVSGGGWCVEEDLDIEMVAAVCPKCTIDLIEVNNASSNALPAGDVEAVKLGAHIVSNSWICYGSVSCAPQSDFDAKGVLYLAATGDRGYNQNGAPEALSTVVAVGGTTLTKSGSKYTEVVWPDAGGGCATGATKPSWQKDPSCTSRTDGDVAAVACICVAEYDSNHGGWFMVGGTSVASPMNAGIFALAGNASTQNAGENFWKLTGKARKHDLHYISSGNDGTCGGSYLCTAGTKQFGEYSGPAGWGTPNGIKAY
jgi:subtilase family serine protease